MKAGDVCAFMEIFAPKALAESWDNTGFLVGEKTQSCSRVMTCLTITPETVREAVRMKADMIVSHHPAPFRALKELTSESTVGRLLRALVKNDVALYCPHTSFDSAPRGINQQLAEGLGLIEIVPFIPNAECGGGTGRMGVFREKRTLGGFLEDVKSLLGLPRVQYVGDVERPVRKVGIGCGSAGEFLSLAARFDCDVFLTGETNFHTCLEAKAQGIALVLMTHFAGEKYACDRLADVLRENLSDLEYVWASKDETDPLCFF